MTRRSGWFALVALVAGACGFAIGALIVDDSDAGPSVGSGTPAETSAAAGFARDMAVHHAQGVEMADTIRTRTTDPAIITLATDIVLTQENQIGRFYGWLEQWGLPPTTATPMVWMGTEHEGLSMSMPGMATRAEVRALDELPVEEAEVAFLRLMIRHHLGALDMADAVVDLTDRPEVLRAAEAVRASQSVEIDSMNTLLEQRGVTVSS